MKLKVILISLAIFLVTGLFVKIKFLTIKNEKLELERQRAESNYLNASLDADANKIFYLKEKELSWSLKTERDSLAKELNIKPKQIDKIVKVEITVHDTVPKAIPVKLLTSGSFEFTDTINKCSIYKGIISLSGGVPSVKRTGFFDQNGVTPVYYWDRPKKFLFIKFGKKQNFVQYNSKCGDPPKVETFEFIK